MTRLISILFVGLLLHSCKPSSGTREIHQLDPSLFIVKSKADSLQINTPLPLSSTEKNWSAKERLAVDRISANFSRTNPNKEARVTNPTVLTIPSDTLVLGALPEKIKSTPMITRVYHPKQIRTGEMRSVPSSAEAIYYLDAEQGLPISNINDIQFDDRGILWIASVYGLIRYDGYSISLYNTANGLPHSIVSKILIDTKKIMWLVTPGGLVRYDGVFFKTYFDPTYTKEKIVSDVCEDQNGDIWFSQPDAGVYKLKNDTLLKFGEKQKIGTSISCIGVDSLNRIFVGYWCAAPNFISNSSAVSKCTDYIAKAYGSNCAMTSYTDRKKNLWLGAYLGGALQFNPSRSLRYDPKTEIGYIFMNDYYEDTRGNMWLATNEGGLVRKSDSTYTFYNTSHGLTSNKITCITGDKNNNIWVGTEGGGICCIKQGGFRSFGLQDGFTDKNVTCMLQNYKGQILFGTWANGVWMYDNKKFAHFKGGRGLGGNIVLAMKEDSLNRLHYALHQFGYLTALPSHNDSVPYDSSYLESHLNGFDNNFTFVLAKDKNKSIWLADRSIGLSVKLTDKYKRITEENGLATKDINDIAFDNENTMWIAHIYGLSSIKGDKITHYTVKSGLPTNACQCLYVDSRNNIWIGTMKGLVCFDRIKFNIITKAQGMSTDAVSSIVEDKKGRLWVGTSKGLNLLSPIKEKQGKYNIIPFTSQDGLKSLEFLSKAVLLDNENRIWWATRKNVVRLDLKEFETIEKQDVVRISQIMLMDQPINFNALADSIQRKKDYFSKDSSFNFNALEFDSVSAFCNLPNRLVMPYDLNNITFNFYSFAGSPIHHTKYRYRLTGEEIDWKETSAPEAVFSNLSYGKYRFEVTTTVDGREWSESSVFEFTIKPPFWQTWWFRTISILVLIYLIFTIVRFREKNLKRRQKELEEEVDKATSLLKEQKQELEIKQKEIHDSMHYASRIQKALMTSEKYIEKILGKKK